MTHDGAHYRVDDVTLLPATGAAAAAAGLDRRVLAAQGADATGRPLGRRRTAVPIANHGEAPPGRRAARPGRLPPRASRGDRSTPYDVILGGISPDPARGARDLIEPLAEAGATWWDERQLDQRHDFYRLDPVLRRIEQGPPSI